MWILLKVISCVWQSMRQSMQVTSAVYVCTHTPLNGARSDLLPAEPANGKAAAISVSLGWRNPCLQAHLAGL